MAFISSRKSFHFATEDKTLDIPAGYVGDIEEWATKTRLYGLAIAGGDIVTAAAEEKAVEATADTPPQSPAGETTDAPANTAPDAAGTETAAKTKKS